MCNQNVVILWNILDYDVYFVIVYYVIYNASLANTPSLVLYYNNSLLIIIFCKSLWQGTREHNVKIRDHVSVTIAQ